MNQMEDYLVEDMWGEMRAVFGDRIDCEEAIDAYKDGDYVRAEKLLPKDALQYLHQIIADFSIKLKLKQKEKMINHAQKWGELNGFTIDADAENDGRYSYYLNINKLFFEITEDSVKHCADEYECYLEDGILKPIAEKY